MKIDFVTIPYGPNAKLRIRRDRIIATVSTPGSNHIDIYTADTSHPWHITDVVADDIIGDIWEGETII